MAGGAGLWKQALAWWGWILLACVAVFLLAWLAIAVSSAGQELADNQALNSGLAALLRGMTVEEGLMASLGARLRDPWVLLLSSGLVALALANALHLLARPRHAGEGNELLQPVENPSTGFAVTEEGRPAASELFVMLLIFTGVLLTLSVEFVYLRDSFSVRMNTIFKFYYQAWVMMGLASAYATWWLLNRLASRAGRTAFLAGAALLLAASLVYPAMAILSRAEGFRNEANLDGASSMARGHPDDWAAIEWLNANVSGAPVILEAPGESYDYEGRISAFTGLPAVLGWSQHEGQWRGSYTEQNLRLPDIVTIYTTSDPQMMLDLLRKWEVEYVVVGAVEMNYIQQQCGDVTRRCNLTAALRKFDLMLEPVFNAGQTTIYVVP